MSLPDGTYISWWPEGECSTNSPRRPAVPHTNLQQDIDAEKEENPPTYYIKVNDDQVKKIKDWWQCFKTKEKYHIIDNNCSTVVYTALKMAFPSVECVNDKVDVWVPVAIQKLAENLTAEVSNFSDSAESIAAAADKEAREIAESGGVKSSKITIEKVRKVLSKAENAKANKTVADESGKKQQNQGTSGKKGADENVQRSERKHEDKKEKEKNSAGGKKGNMKRSASHKTESNAEKEGNSLQRKSTNGREQNSTENSNTVTENNEETEDNGWVTADESEYEPTK